MNTVEVTEDAMESFKGKLTLKETSSNCYRAGSVVGRQYCGFEVNNWVKDVVNPASKSLKEELTWESYDLSQVEPFPFGGEFAEPIERYRDHLKAWIKYSTDLEGCQDIACMQKVINTPNNISTSFKISKIAFENVLPRIDLFGSGERLKNVFES